MKILARLWKLSPVAGILLGLGVLLGFVISVQSAGYFQQLELFAYDRMVALRARYAAWKDPETERDARIVIVAVTAADIAALDYPLTDETLARLLEKITEGKPRAVGLDLYRDYPVPRAGTSTKALAGVFEKHPELYTVVLMEGMPPPAFLAQHPEQAVFNDFPFDSRVVRRGLFYATRGDDTVYSLAAQLVMTYLSAETPPVELGEAPHHPGWISLGGKTIPRFAETDGAYIHADDRGYQYFFDFCGPGPSRFTTYSVKDTLDGRTPSEAFRDRIVLIGAGDPSLNDTLTIPLRGAVDADSGRSVLPGAQLREAGRMPRLSTPGGIYGVELHAVAANQLLRFALGNEQPTSSWSGQVELVWLVGWALAGTLTGFWCRGPWRFSLGVTALMALCVGAGLLLFINRVWVPVAAPAVTALLAAVLVSVYSAGRERRDRAELMAIFSRNLSPAVAETLWQNRDAFAENNRPQPQELTVTVLFTDLVGFSTTSESMKPPDVMIWLNEYMELMAKEVEKHGGVVLKYIGDAVMGVFGAPLARDTPREVVMDASSAVRCALAMGISMAILNTRWKEAGRPQAKMRVGIYTGPVVAGCLGSSSRLEYTILGDTVNTAARLESWEKDYEDPEEPVGDCRILIGETTQQLLTSAIRTKPVREIQLKGKQNATNIHRVLGLA